MFDAQLAPRPHSLMSTHAPLTQSRAEVHCATLVQLRLDRNGSCVPAGVGTSAPPGPSGRKAGAGAKLTKLIGE